ncbi:GIY-YIG nuclease family protein [Variovorax sp. Varisp41]|uniref:GIY-YIG nuclease family protein n=1 Tax=Variovorax sp. Varisp41 TaxID=3243033 RepID=UPI0039B5E823
MAEYSLAERERSGIYEIVNTVNGKRYIGSAVNFHLRWKLHRLHLQRGTHHSKHLQNSWAKQGEDEFEFRILLLCSRDNLLLYEQILLDALIPEYNTARVAGSCLGLRHSPETKAKQALSKMGNQHTLGYRHTPEALEKLRLKQTGVESPTKGKPRDRAAVEATASAHRGMKRSTETRAKIAAKAAGRIRAPETVAKAAEKLRGRKLAPEHAAKLLGNKHAAGRVQTEEERARRGASVRAAWAAKKAAGIPWRLLAAE